SVRLAAMIRRRRTRTSSAMPARIDLGLSRNGRRGTGGGAAAFSPARFGVTDVTVAAMRPHLLLLDVQQIFQLAHELAEVAEVAVDRREPDVRDFVELLQLLHDEAADLGRRDFLLRTILQRGFDAIRN